MTEKQFAEIQERYANLPAVGVSSQVRIDLAACISEITRVGAPFEPSDEERQAKEDFEIAKREAERETKHTSGARKK